MAHVHICVLLSSSFAFADGQSPAPDSVQDPGITRNMEPVSAGKRLLGIVPNYRTSPLDPLCRQPDGSRCRLQTRCANRNRYGGERPQRILVGLEAKAPSP